MTEGPAALQAGLRTADGPPEEPLGTQPEVVAAHTSASKTLAGYTDVRDGRFMYRFIGQQTCSRCGDTGHVASVCSVPQCSQCERYGHRAACCSEACGRCGRQHAIPKITKGKKCRTPHCRNCKRFGHAAECCPLTQCMRCEFMGHMVINCPVPPEVGTYSSSNGVSVAEQLALRAVDSAKDGGQSLIDSLVAQSDDSSVKTAAKKPAKQTSSDHALTAASRLEKAARILDVVVKQLPSLELRPPAATKEEQQDRSSKLIHELCLAQHAEYVLHLIANEQKLACLSRISEDALASVLNHRTVGLILDAVYQKQLELQQEEEERQQRLEHQRQLEQQQQEEQQRQREQYEQQQPTLEHQRLREQRDRQQRQQRHRQRPHVNHQRGQQQCQRPIQHPPHRGHQQPPQPGQQQPTSQHQQLLPHSCRQTAVHSGQQYRNRPPWPQQQSSQPHRPQQPVKPRIELNVLDAVLPKGGKVGDVLVCLACGSKGHQVDKCKTPFCSECCKYGHQAGTCKSACLKCGWKHSPPFDDDCKVSQCQKCSLWGHTGEDCPVPRCSHCDKYGHASTECRKLAARQQPVKRQTVAPAIVCRVVGETGQGGVPQSGLTIVGQSGLTIVGQSGLTTVGVMPYNPLAGQVVGHTKPEPPNIIF